MLIRFLFYGVLGWVIEIVWTGLGSILRRDSSLVAQTYLWMFPIYGAGGLAFELVHRLIGAQPWFIRGGIWVASIFAVEYATGALLRRMTGRCPWDYSGTPLSIKGLIRLDYAPAWFVLGLLYEQVRPVVATIAGLLG